MQQQQFSEGSLQQDNHTSGNKTLQMNNRTLYLQQLEKEQHKKTQIKQKERSEQKKKSEVEMKKTIEKIEETKSWFFGKINKTDKLLARLIKTERQRAQINKVRKMKRTSYS